MKKYELLVNVLDQIRREAPAHLLRYRPIGSNQEKVDQARSKAYIHLFLQVRFGLLDFMERENLITEGSYDGGIDAYYIDTDNRKIYFIQSKFRTTSDNFDKKNIELEELLKIEVDRITAGETVDESGNSYSGKIQGLIRELSKIDAISRYEYIIIILANLKELSEAKIKRLIGGYPIKVFNNNKCYSDLLFPIVSGTYFNSPDLSINIDLLHKESAQSRIGYFVDTEEIECEITLLFVPTIEIAKVLSKYKNSILKYNPRSYLSLSTNSVNTEIAKTITDNTTNEFALYNNGITMLSDETEFTDRTGRKSVGQLTVKNPQILNGGQTAYTLSHIYNEAIENGNSVNIFANKEVMLKVITFIDASIDETKRLKLIEAISKATNQQSPIVEADRRSNDKVQVELQKRIYDDFGYFYERKEGEFFDGLKHHYLSGDVLIERGLLIRIASAIAGSPEGARGNSAKVLFSKPNFDSIYKNSDNYKELFFSYLCYLSLDQIQHSFSNDPNNRFGVANYGNALRYGKFAVVYATYANLAQHIEPSNVSKLANSEVAKTLDKWLAFEDFARRRPENRRYFYEQIDEDTGDKYLETNFDSYYKVVNVKNDLDKFFSIK